MATISELRTRREALAVQRSSGVARVSYDGKTVDYRSVAEIDRAIEALDREIATLEGRRIVRQVRITHPRGSDPWAVSTCSVAPSRAALSRCARGLKGRCPSAGCGAGTRRWKTSTRWWPRVAQSCWPARVNWW